MEKENNMANVIVKNFEYKGRRFAVVKHESGMYMAVDYNYIDAAGRLTRTVRGGHETIADCLQATIYMVEFEAAKALGMTDLEAMQRVMNIIPRAFAEVTK